MWRWQGGRGGGYSVGGWCLARSRNIINLPDDFLTPWLSAWKCLRSYCLVYRGRRGGRRAVETHEKMEKRPDSSDTHAGNHEMQTFGETLEERLLSWQQQKFSFFSVLQADSFFSLSCIKQLLGPLCFLCDNLPVYKAYFLRCNYIIWHFFGFCPAGCGYLKTNRSAYR